MQLCRLYLSGQVAVVGQARRTETTSRRKPSGDVSLRVANRFTCRKAAPLRALEPVYDATLFGEAIHLLVSDKTPVEQILSAADIVVSDGAIREVGPSLEDVFVTLTKAAEQYRLASVEDVDSHLPSDQARSEDAGTMQAPHSESDSHTPALHLESEGYNSVPHSESEGYNTAPHLESEGHSEAIQRHRHRRTLDGLLAILIKEFVHIRRQRSTLFFMLVVPVMQTIIFGVALDTQVEHIPTVVLDLDNRQASRELTEAFVNTRQFEIVEHVYDHDSFRHSLTSGRARVGMIIPPHYSERLLQGEQVQVQVLVDGSDSQVATTALNAASLLGMNLSVNIARPKIETAIAAPSRDPVGRGIADRSPSSIALQPRLGECPFFCAGVSRHYPAASHTFPHVLRHRRRARTWHTRTVVRHTRGANGFAAGEAVTLRAGRIHRNLDCPPGHGVRVWRANSRELGSVVGPFDLVPRQCTWTWTAGFDAGENASRSYAIRVHDHVAIGVALWFRVPPIGDALSDL